MKILILLLFAVPVLAQLPDRGSMTDLKGMSRVYVIADAANYKPVIKQLKALTVVTRPDDAQFFLEYKTLSQSTVGVTGMHLATGEMNAYVTIDGHKILAWSDSLVGGAFKGDTASKLAKRFIKEWKRSNKLAAVLFPAAQHPIHAFNDLCS